MTKATKPQRFSLATLMNIFFKDKKKEEKPIPEFDYDYFTDEDFLVEEPDGSSDISQ